MQHPIKTLLARRLSGEKAGIFSACTANGTVIEAVCEFARDRGGLALIEATANQVNQFGGYTGMTPENYANFVKSIAAKAGLTAERLVLGGDHLGPLVWQNEEEGPAMQKALELVRAYAEAGFTKIHIDTSMRLAGDDKNARLPDQTIARRGALLAAECEKAFAPNGLPHIYCVGSEVPIPGGARHEESVTVTSPDDFRACVAAFRDAFPPSAWENVAAVVVQPGVEFGDTTITPYDAKKAEALTKALGEFPGLVFEGHSTDYQTPQALKEMVRDGIAILKVGPGLTFALREGLYALEQIERAVLPMHGGLSPSNFAATLLFAMQSSPADWNKYYRGSPAEINYKLSYSFSDRCRYYLPFPAVRAAQARLISNLEKTGVPLALLSQFLPRQYTRVRTGELENKPTALLKDRVRDCIEDYAFAEGR